MVLFRVYRRYFDQFRSGEKRVELRRMSPYWVRVARNLAKREPPWPGTIACGLERLDGEIVGIRENVRAVEVLGRPLSDQGVADLGGEDPRVIAFFFGPLRYSRRTPAQDVKDLRRTPAQDVKDFEGDLMRGLPTRKA